MGEQAIKFLVVGIDKCEKKIPWAYKILKFFHKNPYDIRGIQKLIYHKDEIVIMNKHGLLIELPFTQEEISTIPPEYLEAYIHKILEVYDIPNCYLRRELKRLNDRFDMNKKWIFQYLLFDKGIDLFFEKYNIQKKDAKFVIIDSGNKRVELILQVILEYANYVTIVTNRQMYFAKAVEVVYEETGLLMDVVSSYTQKNITGNVVINLDKDCYGIYNNFEENAFVIDLQFTDKKLEYLSNRRRDLTILYDYDILVDKKELEKELVAEVMVRDNWKLSRFSKRNDGALTINEIRNIVEYYKLEIKKLNTISTR